jgi:TRAP transporter TAXI family solute receptor
MFSFCYAKDKVSKPPRPFPEDAMRNRTQIILLLTGTALLTALIVTLATLWLTQPETLKIAVGPAGGVEYKFAEKLATLLAQNHASVRLSVIPQEGGAQAVGRLARREADLAIVRTDAKLPGHARALAILEHDMVLLIGPPVSTVKTIGDLAGKKIAVLGDDGRNEALIRHILSLYDINTVKARTVLQTVPPASPIDDLLAAGGFDIAISIEPLSRITKTSDFSDLSTRMGGFSLYGIGESKAMQLRIPGLFAETINAGLLSESPRTPDDDLDTVGLQRLLVARGKVADGKIGELMRVIFENKSELAIDQTFATAIEPPDLEKDALVPAHTGASQYVEGEEETFVDRYSDIMYLTMSVGSIIGSLGLATFTALTRVRPRRASERTDELLAVTDKIKAAVSQFELDLVETELEDILKNVLRGLKDGTVSANGLDAFRLCYEHAREALNSRRHTLPRDAQPPSPTRA